MTVQMVSWCRNRRQRNTMLAPISDTGMDIDYGINTAQGDSRYIVNTQLVEYGQAI